ncbi:unnamed protein product [Hanseniaspora opuntiae]
MNYNQYDSDQDNSDNLSQSSKMSRMGGILKQAKTIYLPTLSLTAKQLASEASLSFKSLYSTQSSLNVEFQGTDSDKGINRSINDNQPLFYNNGNVELDYGNNLSPDSMDLSDLKITIYNSYTYHDEATKKYVTEIKGNVCLYNNLNQLHSTDSRLGNPDHTIFDSRIYPFLNKGVACFPLVLQLNNIGVEHTLTKSNGDFYFEFVTDDDISKNKKENALTLRTNLKPQSVILGRQQEIDVDSLPNNSRRPDEFKDFTVDIDLFHYSSNSQIAIISDIDDTIKFTGVVESKKCHIEHNI